MACGCGKRVSTPRRVTIRSVATPRTNQIVTARLAPSPAQLHSTGLTSVAPVFETRRMDDQKLRLEKLRRQAILNKLNK